MKQLSEFTTIEDAKDYPFYKKGLVAKSTMLGYLDAVGCLPAITKLSQDWGHPFQSAAIATLSSPEFNFQLNDPRGEHQIARINQTIDANIDVEVTQGVVVNLTTPLTTVRDMCIAECNKEFKPYGNVTEHEYLVATDSCPIVPVNQSNGWVTITLISSCEVHNPRLLVQDGPVLRRINNFKNVGSVSEYHAEVPSKYRSYQIYVDNAYEVI